MRAPPSVLINSLLAVLLGTVALAAQAPDATPAIDPTPTPSTPPTFQVFLLAGQSNMEGQAVVDLDHEQHYNGGRGTLARLLEDAELEPRLAHLRGEDGEWATRDDVFCWYRTGHGTLKRGPLSVGFAVYDGRHHFGPELQFGHLVGDRFDEPVLLVKTAWGGKSLHTDFRPPSAGGTTGPYWERMLREYREALADVQDMEPFAGREPHLAGFVWFQGWNDMFEDGGQESYADNLVALAGDLRAALQSPDLPIVVGETGNAGRDAFREQQRLGTERIPAPRSFVPTRAFLRPAEDSPNTGHGHHWYGNAESYFLIGDALGRAMLELLPPAEAR